MKERTHPLRLGAGDCVFPPMGSEHKIIAIADCVEFWAELPLRGRRRAGHLHRSPENEAD